MEVLPELEHLRKVIDHAGDLVETRVLTTVNAEGHEFPVHGLVIGTKDRTKPTLGLFGGVHGLERVGTQVLTAYLESLFHQLKWDRELAARFENVRLVAIPIVNPGGMFMGSRCNPNGVDIMRNSPVEAMKKPLAILGGHRWTPRLPYFRGTEGAPMEAESLALANFVREEMFDAETAVAVDLHSGFGAVDRLWYPYAKSTDPFPRLKQTLALGELFTKSYPNHVYRIEPQSLSYTTHGDMWDFLFDEHLARHGLSGPSFIPWTLEMGSWIWIRKNPIQIFDLKGVFNPIKQHRLRRTLRRHMPLLDFLLRAVKHHESWSQ